MLYVVLFLLYANKNKLGEAQIMRAIRNANATARIPDPIA